MAFPERGMAKAALAPRTVSWGCSEHLEAPPGCESGSLTAAGGFALEDEGASELSAVPSSRMHRVISQL